ncbi:MAG TPA: hypothetical protein VES67_20280 [Vicinamibacterales bacterium]|nr:hypothetical protein [Vicinamibacterales bacterium]
MKPVPKAALLLVGLAVVVGAIGRMVRSTVRWTSNDKQGDAMKTRLLFAGMFVTMAGAVLFAHVTNRAR